MSALTRGNAIVGGVPTVSLDIPISAVFLALYIAGAALNITIFIANKRRGHKFIISILLNGFCIIRILTCSMRMAWATHLTNSSIVVTAQVFNSAGIILIYIINLVFAQRILRARQPAIGWLPPVGIFFKALYICIVGSLIMGIVALALLVSTTSPKTIAACRDVQLASITFLLVLTTLPLFFLAITYLLPESPDKEEFGQGTMAHKVIIVTLSTCLSITVAGYKAGAAWDVRPLTNPGWFDSKPAFYVFGFTLEIFILVLFIFTRVDRRFHIPDQCTQPGDYSRGVLRSSAGEESKSSGV
ncbi:hypothetical protein AK830_g2775 [Neonectria ditissima]|uniref:G-protein coupled receptors family 3 profile domain-containing protein n=1 Tax=Neonectria ditissima TaxID=78410 RepID=A0A0P7BAB3_9HYPO|nr:hypothetical protein AK830_g2775 [Neonectria ditissima]